MKLLWTHRARQDLIEIGQYIAEDDPDAARRWVAHLRSRAGQAARAPQGGRVVPELGRSDIREVIERTYRIVYRIGEEAIEVLTVFEGHRLLRPEPLAEGGDPRPE
jgi:toxin ParE1/3/4